jgi:hypothetical protein
MRTNVLVQRTVESPWYIRKGYLPPLTLVVRYIPISIIGFRAKQISALLRTKFEATLSCDDLTS